MTTTIPRAEIDAIMRRHGDTWPGRYDVPPNRVRMTAAEYRQNADHADSEAERQDLIAEADDLDALADRYEQEAANAMWAHTDGITP